MPHSLPDMGKQLKYILNDKRIKIVDFAAMAGFTNQIAHYYLRKKEIKRATLERFCQLIGITVQDFMEWSGVQYQEGTLHYGRRFRTLIVEKGINKTRLATLLKMTRKEAAALDQKPVFSETELDAVLKGLNISREYFLNPMLVEDAPPPREHQMRERYYRLLEEHNWLLKEVADYKEQVRLLQQEVARLTGKTVDSGPHGAP
ncbi:Cro/C1-type HTH DNA-binding domain-containing protein [Chitinophaga costaii]|uniref:Cro/C1-type HTH DNA-binding domain-containing protein n=1 Tax=Chitinophaga costaii TaxID=1335309 RepID=A0A1C4FS86_9BACT|nr:helix-turn-helix transcriptional regulator [Chitinophaga costaii]PUZ20505.1 hypothetical protein DCM91_18915 [Chitinophaga costaii]SCC58736.1 Cro/C1-type HTH DNA-binding domain-containing protein [Chitinophaga costaii]